MKSAFLSKTSRDEAGRRRAKVWAFTDLPEEINGDQTLLNFSFNCGLQDDSWLSCLLLLHAGWRIRRGRAFRRTSRKDIWKERTQTRLGWRRSLHACFSFLSSSSLLHFPNPLPAPLMCLPVCKSFLFLLLLALSSSFVSNPQSCCEVSLRS